MTSTTSQPAPPEPGAVSPAELAAWVADATGRLADLVADLTDEQLQVPELDIVNPILWEIGHVTWFQESFVLRRTLGEAPLVAHGDALWDSAAIPHATRWHLALPSRQETRAYMDQVAATVAARVTAPTSSKQLRFLARYALHHHDMHTEALTYTRQTLGYPPARFTAGADLAGPAVTDAVAGPLDGDVAVPGGWFPLGADRHESFVFDNEKWAHPVQLAPFQIARAAVTQAEFAAFVDDGGYRSRSLWSDAGWAWRSALGAEHPVYWRRVDAAGAPVWERRHFDRWTPLEPHRPVSHVCFYEAQAFCRWARRRLPSEAEWEAAAVGQPAGAGETGRSALAVERRRFPWGGEPVTAARANVDWVHGDTVDVAAYPAGDSAFGCRQMLGNVWEWTASSFEPYPGFEQDAYRDNSWPWFGSRMVLRGGAWATRGRLLRATLRNYFTPDRRDVFAGLRTCALDG